MAKAKLQRSATANNEPMSIDFLPDRLPKAEFARLYPEAEKSLRGRWPVMMDGAKELIAWVGIAHAEAGGAIFFVPHGTPPEHSSREEFASSLMRAIVRFARERKRTGDGSLDEGPNQAALLADIAADYRDFGLYTHRERIRTRNSGKPDWARTVRSQVAFEGQDGSAVYCDLEGARPSTFATNVLARIQSEIVVEIARVHGWWLADQFGAREIPRPSIARWPRRIWPKLLQTARRDLYQSRAVRLANLLLAYLDNDRRAGVGATICGVSDFSTMWEEMLRKVLPDVDDRWNARMPGPAYIDASGARNDSGRMEMDIVIGRPNKILIADAKYYRATSVALAPGWADIVKQIYYQQCLSTIPEAADSKIVNVLIFPGAITARAPFQFVRMYSRNGDETAGFPFLNCQYVSMREVITAYSRRQLLSHTQWLDDLLDADNGVPSDSG